MTRLDDAAKAFLAAIQAKDAAKQELLDAADEVRRQEET